MSAACFESLSFEMILDLLRLLFPSVTDDFGYLRI
jgi:hypothetical protein